MAQYIRKAVLINTYRAISFATLSVNKLIRPAALRTIESLSQVIATKESEESSTKDKIITTLRSSIGSALDATSKYTDTSLTYISQSLTSNQRELEERLAKDFNVEFSGWLLSAENLTVMEKILQSFAGALMKIQGISSYQAFQYLILFTDLQKIARTYAPEMVYGIDTKKLIEPLPELQRQEIERIREDAHYHLLFATAVYGRPNRVDFIIQGNGPETWEQNFLKGVKLQTEDLIHACWKSFTYKPVFAFARDSSVKKFVLSIRGTRSILDFLTDIDAEYFNISLRRDPKGKLYLKVHHTSHMDLHLKQKISAMVPIINFEEESRVNTELEEEKVESHQLHGVENKSAKNMLEDEELYRGWIHAGMFTAALSVFHEVKPTVEKTFANPEYKDYQFSISGHSLGGGISTILTLLFLVYPPSTIENPSERIIGYSYGTAAVLSKEFFPLLKDNLISVVNETDLVPRLSAGSVRDTLDVIRALDLCEQKEPGVTKTIVSYALKEDEKSQANRPQSLKKTLELFNIIKKENMNSVKLLPQGRIFLMTKQFVESKGIAFVEVKDCEFFNQLIFSRDLFINHLPKSYEVSMQLCRAL